MKLIEYLPNFMQDITEFKELFKAEDVEVEKLNTAIQKIYNEIIVKLAESYGLERYEKIYNIREIAVTIEARRTNILLKMNSRVPYSKKWLKNLLDTVIGKDNYKLTIDESKHLVNIGLPLTCNELSEMLKKELRIKIPANMELQYDFYTNMELYVGAIVIQEQEYFTINAI